MGDGGRSAGIQDFTDLRVWQIAVDLVEEVYRVTKSFPWHELYGLASQLQRATVSVSANLAEGHTRGHLKEYLHHVSIARASLAEVRSHLVIAGRIGYLGPDELHDLQIRAVSLARQLTSLRNSLMQRA